MTEPTSVSTPRTKAWRKRQGTRPGGLVQVNTWVPRAYAQVLRKIFARLGDPDWHGSALRGVVAHWPYRRRPVASRMLGGGYVIEIDAPQIDDGRELIPIGGRIFGNGPQTFVELTPSEAAELKKDLEKAVAQVAHEFIMSHDLDRNLRDCTGVLLPEAAPHHAGFRPSNLRVFNVDRPESTAQFEAREAVVASDIFKTNEEVVLEEVSSGLYELCYLGETGMPSRSLLFVGKRGEADRTIDDDGGVIALIGLPFRGTPPTLVFAQVVKAVLKKLPADIGGAPLRYLDVEPDEFSVAGGLRISEVMADKELVTLEWVPNPKIPFSLNHALRASLDHYRGWRERGRFKAEDAEALGSIEDGGSPL
jgi:hypothetical protein